MKLANSSFIVEMQLKRAFYNSLSELSKREFLTFSSMTNIRPAAIESRDNTGNYLKSLTIKRYVLLL